jgi:hypothetical protein
MRRSVFRYSVRIVSFYDFCFPFFNFLHVLYKTDKSHCITCIFFFWNLKKHLPYSSENRPNQIITKQQIKFILIQEIDKLFPAVKYLSILGGSLYANSLFEIIEYAQCALRTIHVI